MEGKQKPSVREIIPYTAEATDPFVLNQRLSFLQILKSVVLSVTLLPVRLLLMFSVLLFTWVIGAIALIGIPKDQANGLEPLSGWRRRWAKPLVANLARLVFFMGGWYWVPQKGRRATAKEAPILLVMPHSSFLDTVMVIALRCPGMVVKDSTERAPLFGRLVKLAQPLFVKSEDPHSRRRIVEDIRQRVTSGKDWEQLLLFPEGGCGNRTALLQFKLGGFTPGVPVQPVFIRYKNKLDTVTWSWEGPGALKQLWLTLTQFRICCELEFLPVYRPSKLEQEDPKLFADNVQHFVSSWTKTPVSRFSIEDARYLKVAKNKQLPPTVAMVKFLRLRSAIGRQALDPSEELKLLKVNNNSSGQTHGNADFMASYLGLKRCPAALIDFFHFMDQHKRNILDVRIYEAGLCLIEEDLKIDDKLKAALTVFGTTNELEHLEAIFLLWRGIPSAFGGLETCNSLLSKMQTEALFSS